MFQPRGRFLLTVIGALSIVSACSHKPDQPSTPTAPTPAAPAPPPGPPEPPIDPPQPVTCTYALLADPHDFERDGGNGSLRITTAAGCRWSVSADAPWATIEGPNAGEGPATLKVFAQPNEDAQERSQSFRVADQRAFLVQAGQGNCTFEVRPVTTQIPRDRWLDTVAISTDRGCRWTAASADSWLQLKSATGSGTASLGFEAEFNPDNGYSTSRTAKIEIRWLAPTAGQNVFITQWGSCHMIAAANVLPPGATFSGSPAGGTVTVGADGGTVRLFVLSEPFMNCRWTMESSDTWVDWAFPQLHAIQSGDGDTRFIVPSNPSSNGRTAKATLNGWPLTVIQRGR